MAGKGISRVDVEAILNEHPEFSNREIRTKLGTGSFATISKFASEWRESRRRIDAVDAPLPEIVAKSIMDWHERLITENRGDLLKELALEKQALSEVQEEAESQALEIERLQQELQEATKKLTSISILYDELNKKFDTIHRELALERAKHEDLPQRLHVLENENMRLREKEIEAAVLNERLQQLERSKNAGEKMTGEGS